MNSFAIRLGLSAFALFALFAFLTLPAARADDKKDDKKDDKAVNVTGTYTWTMNRNGQDFTTTLKLKQEGKELKGTISGRQGSNDTEITEGKVDGSEVSFTVTREFNGNAFVIKYKGKLEGDTIKGKVGIDRDGETMERDWEAKREKKDAA